jgi:hypothetical protein
MKRHLVLMILAVTIGHSAAFADQKPAPPPAPQGPGAPPGPKTAQAPPAPQTIVDPEAGGQPVNIRLDVSLVDQSGPAPAAPKTVMVMLVDRAMGRTRSVFEDRTINVDARPEIRDGRIRLYVTVQSAPILTVMPVHMGGAKPELPDHTLDWRNSFSLLLENGKPMVALESNDAAKSRKLSLEVKATIMK